MNSSSSGSSTWLEVGGAAAPEMARLVEERAAQRIASGDYTRENVRYVGELQRPAAPGKLDVSAESLAYLRRLCQLWEVDLRPARSITSHRKIIGPVIVAFKRMAFPIVRFFMRETLKQQRDFNAAVVEAVTRIYNEVERK